MSKREQVAKSLYEKWNNIPACTDSKPWEITCEKLPGQAEFFRKLSDVALDAMLEPTEGMLDAMDEHAGSIAPQFAYEAAIQAAKDGA